VKTKPTKLPPVLTLEFVRRLIRKNTATHDDWMIAASVLCISKRATFEDLLVCLRRYPVKWRAAYVLHRRTGRPQEKGKLVLGPKNWRRYLKAKGLL
jgi:hypothetical protein